MKLIVIGDSHGDIANIKHVMGFAKKVKADAVIHTGDWNNTEAVNAVFNFNIPVYSVLGNADVDPQVERLLKQRSEGFALDRLKVNLENRKIGVIHSFSAKGEISSRRDGKVRGEWYKNCDIVFSGHRHSQDERVVNGVKVVRPGALVNEISFAVYESEANEVEFISL